MKGLDARSFRLGRRVHPNDVHGRLGHQPVNELDKSEAQDHHDEKDDHGFHYSKVVRFAPSLQCIFFAIAARVVLQS